MTKVIKIFLIFLLSILVVGLLGVMIYFMSGGSINFSNRTSDKLVIEEIFESDKDIYINADASKVEIKTSDNNEIKVLVYSEDDMKNNANTNDNKIYIKSKKAKKRFMSFNQKLAKIEIFIPVNYNNIINVETKVGDIDIEGSVNSKAIIKSDVGDIDIEKVNVVDIEARVGDVEIDRVNSAKIEMDVGDLEIDSVNEYMDISLNCGDVEIDSVNLIKDSTIDMNLGDIQIDNISDIYIETKIDLGDVKINKNYKDADIILTIKNNTGDINIRN